MRKSSAWKSWVGAICAAASLLVGVAPLPAQAPLGLSVAANEADSPPGPGQAQRNWLTAHLIVDHKLSGAEAQSLEQKLANLSDDQVDVATRVYQQKRGEQRAAAEAERGLAQQNLDQLKNYRDALASEVSDWRAVRQAQYLNFGSGWGGYGPYGYGYGYGPGFGAGGFGVAGGGFGVGGFGAYGSGLNFGAYPYGFGFGTYPSPVIAAPYGWSGLGAYPGYSWFGAGVGVY